MAIITLMVLGLAITIPTALFEGCRALYRRAKDAAEWRKLKRMYY